MERYLRCEGVLVEPVGHLWAAFSPWSGETALLNDESASILEVLQSGPCDTRSVCSMLAADSGLDADSLVDIVEMGWLRLNETGLVCRQRADLAETR